MHATMRAVTISFLGFLVIAATSLICFCDGNSNVLCIESERRALLKFKHDLIDHSNSLSSWGEDHECCGWLGVICNNLAGHVNELHLGISNYLLEAKTLQWVSGLSSLEYLDLSGANLSEATDWQQVTSKLPSLVELHLPGCNLNDDPSPVSVNYTSLAILDLSSNLLSSVPTWIFSLRSLVSIDLSWNNVSGVIPSGFGNMSCLKFLSLSSNPFSQSSIPLWLSNLSHLHVLSLSNVSLQGNIWNVIGNLSSITHLDVSYNQLSGPFPLGFYLSSLESLDVSKNRLGGTLPQSLGQLGNLEMLELSNNMLEGNASEMHFFNLTRLKGLRASNNNLTFKPNPSWIPPFDCQIIEMGNWHLGPQFPQWLQFQKNLTVLDLSDAGMLGVIPTWFWNISTQLLYLNLSHNQLAGEISVVPEIFGVDLSSNQFIGPLPQVTPYLNVLFLSKNLFSGSLSHFLCSSLTMQPNLFYLDLGSNLLSGDIPDCWKNWPELVMINLGNNNLTGKIPRSLGSIHGIRALYLRNNSLFGEVPSTMQHLANLLILDLSENQFNGSIPAWIGDKLSQLMVLNLRSNKFQAHIPHQICALHSLQILDLGYNNISGAIPKCLSNLSAMATKPLNPQVHGGFCYYSTCFLGALLEMKGREDEYSTTLGLVTSMDLSVNCLIGEVPKELGNLKALLSLNLSRNLLTGKIAESIGNMESLESLDLSMNRFDGEIPPSFSNLNFLNHFNLSYNNLTGQIPSSTQLQSFDRFAYIGNHLSGPPVTKNCSTKSVTPNVTNGGSEGPKELKVNGFYLSIVIGFVMGFWGVVAPLFFIRSWRHAYYQKLDCIGHRLYVLWATSGV